MCSRPPPSISICSDVARSEAIGLKPLSILHSPTPPAHGIAFYYSNKTCSDRVRSVPITRQAGSTHASTSAEVLDGLLEKHPVVAPILEFRGVNKYKTT